MKIKHIVGTFAASAALLMFSSANAAWTSCSADVAGKVVANSGCEFHSTFNQDFLNTTPITVNQDGGAFGNTDWEYISRTDLDTNDNGQAGTWSTMGALFAAYQEVMIIFKDGADTTLHGYLVAVNSEGTWNTPFLVGSTFKDVSHFTYYGRGMAADVSEPAILGLLGLGLFGLAFARRRKA
jgi:hypothetical protein